MSERKVSKPSPGLRQFISQLDGGCTVRGRKLHLLTRSRVGVPLCGVHVWTAAPATSVSGSGWLVLPERDRCRRCERSRVAAIRRAGGTVPLPGQAVLL